MNPLEATSKNRNIQQARESIPDVETIIQRHDALPNPFVPASTSFFQEQFYWDSYFIMTGLVELGRKGQEVAKGMVENFFKMLDEYGYIPNSYNKYDTRSQPPFLSSMVKLVYNSFQDKKWLKEAFGMVKKEYETAWVNDNSLRFVKATELSRYNDDREPKNKTWGPWYGALQESGWDNTTRFYDRIHHTNPVDLNSLLFKYEKDLVEMSDLLGFARYKEEWQKKLEQRKTRMNGLMWNQEEGMFFDYDYESGEKLDTKSLATYFPLWAGLANSEQAAAIQKQISVFERERGLATTEERLADEKCQWTFPNGWAPLQWIAINGLRNCGFSDDANRLTYKWLKNCADNFTETGRWDEKFSVLNDVKRTEDPRYNHQAVTYWTMGVFIALYEQIKRIGK
jgi:alpha,alpha-trehalase